MTSYQWSVVITLNGILFATCYIAFLMTFRRK